MLSDSESSTSSTNEDIVSYGCELCYEEKITSEIITLTCGHIFCLLCLEEYILNHFEIKIKCPLDDCEMMITDVEVKETLSDEDVKQYERLCTDNIPNTHRCILPGCNSIIWYGKGDKSYTCINCSLFNCLKCDKPHKSMSCSKFKKLNSEKAKEKCQVEISNAEAVLLKKSITDFDLVPNDRIFICRFCEFIIAKNSGVKLRSCDHLVCKDCLKTSIMVTPVIPPTCQYEDCPGTLQDREIYAILSEEELLGYNRKNFTRIKLKLDSTFQCQQNNCDFFCELIDSKATVFFCEKCKSENCLKCKAIHNWETCAEYNERIRNSELGIQEAQIQLAIDNGEVMKCPDCTTLVKKGSGCNWIQCSNCGLELCWILKMRRWGPNGRGDISGGCKCEDGNYCHPDCYGCIPDN